MHFIQRRRVDPCFARVSTLFKNTGEGGGSKAQFINARNLFWNATDLVPRSKNETREREREKERVRERERERERNDSAKPFDVTNTRGSVAELIAIAPAGENSRARPRPRRQRNKIIQTGNNLNFRPPPRLLCKVVPR